jgi:release factor glutamine methyltransferase
VRSVRSSRRVPAKAGIQSQETTAPATSAHHLIEQAAGRLAAFPNPALDAELLFRGVTGIVRAALLTLGEETVTDDVISKFEAAVARRERGEPVQYILGISAFWRDEFVVTPDVLIPRPETEVLVEAMAKRLRTTPSPLILDIGTGSGCIALSLLRELDAARATAIDVSGAALGVASRNADRLGLAGRLRLVRSNWYDGLEELERFDAVVSNPPYVAREDSASLPSDVRDFEPATALFANDGDDLSSYRAILGGIGARLRPRGLVGLEVGLGQAERVAALATAEGLKGVDVLEDLARIPRVVIGHSAS